jgi:hypothetical protein
MVLSDDKCRWKDSCVRSQESLKAKLEKLNKEIHTWRLKVTGTKDETGGLMLDERKSKSLYSRLENLLSE